MSNSWTTFDDVKQKLLKQWQQGKWLHSDRDALFPLTIKLKAPTSKQLLDEFLQSKKWIEYISSSPDYPIDYKEIQHQKLGKNKIPKAIVIATLEHAVRLINKQKDAEIIQRLSHKLTNNFPELTQWVSKNPFKTLQYEDQWADLIQATHWMINNPKPNIYIRQIKLTEVDTKLIEQHKVILSQWWETVLKATDINEQETGSQHFEQRFGFKTKPTQIRFRILDPSLFINGLSDLTISIEAFSQLTLNVDKVFVTENDINGLVFPNVAKAIVIFGRGYCFEQWDKITWLKYIQLYYWGDVDTHGFAILSQFRSVFPKTQSILMTEELLMAHKNQWVKEQKQTTADLQHLNPMEYRLFNKLRDNQIKTNLRLEQEFIGFDYVVDALSLTALVKS